MSAYTEAVERVAAVERPRPPTILELAAETCTPDHDAVRKLLAPFKPPHLLTGDELARYEAERAARERLRLRRKRLHDSGVVRVLQNPGRDVAAIVDGAMRPRPALEIVRLWWAEGEPLRPWLFVGGTVGVGKTWAGAWVIADAGGKYISATHLIRAAEATRAARGPMQQEHADAAWHAIVSAHVLVLDELGREPWPATRDPLHDLVDQRGGRPTLVLSNVASADLKAAFAAGQLDRRTASRLAPLTHRDPHGRACWDVTGADMREEAA